MNENLVRKIVACTSGFIMGSGLGYALSGYILRKIEERDRKNKVEALMEDYEDVRKGEHLTYILNDNEVTKEEYDEWIRKGLDKDDTTNSKVNFKASFGNIKPTDYTLFSKIPDGKEDLEKVAEKYLGEGLKQPIEDVGPHLITYEEYGMANDQNGNRRISITYYEVDKILVDENIVPIQIPEEMVGPNALLSFGKMSDDPNIVFVRNDKLGLDIEVVRLQKSYDETVLGKPTKEKAKEKAKAPSRERAYQRSSTRKVDTHDDDPTEE